MSAFVPVTLLNALDASLAGPTNSNGVYCDQIQNLSYIITSTGSPVGTLTIQVSNDPVAPAQGANPSASVVNWATVGTPTAISSATSTPINLSNVGYLWTRVSYAKTSGTGAITVNFCGKP